MSYHLLVPKYAGGVNLDKGITTTFDFWYIDQMYKRPRVLFTYWLAVLLNKKSPMRAQIFKSCDGDTLYFRMFLHKTKQINASKITKPIRAAVMVIPP